MEKLDVVAEDDEGRGSDTDLGHIVDLQSLAFVGRRLSTGHGVVEDVVEHTRGDTGDRLTVNVIYLLKKIGLCQYFTRSFRVD